MRYTRTRIPRERKAQLDELGVTWEGVWEQKTDEKWNNMFKRLQKYQEEHGDLLVPQRWQGDGERPTLGNWVHEHRKAYRQGILRKERIKKLNDIGFAWEVNRLQARNTNNEPLWDQHYNELIDYKRSTGHWPSETVKLENNFCLGRWIKNLRFRHNNNLLSEERKRKLDNIGFILDPQDDRDLSWSQQYETWKAHQNSTENMPISSAQWAWMQRLSKEKGILDTERKALLDEIGFDWNIKECKPH